MSITAEKISKERIEELRCRADDVKRYSKAPRPTMAVFADDILAILSLLQQGEPEGWKETLEAIRDKANAAVSHVGRANYRERQTEAHQWVNKAVDAAMLSASPLPPAPGAETGGRRLGTAEALQFSDFRKLPEEVRKHFEEIEMFLSDVDGKDLATFTEDSALDEGTIDCENVVRAVNAIAAWVQSSSRQAVLEETLLSLCSQIERDLKSAHAEICKLQRIDPKTHTWPEWSPQANTLHWVKKIRSEIIDDASFDDLRASGGVFATTPSAEGETK